MAIAIVALDVIVFARLVPEVRSVGTRPFWTGALWALYGGLSEEIVLRYGAMSFTSQLPPPSFRSPQHR